MLPYGSRLSLEVIISLAQKTSEAGDLSVAHSFAREIKERAAQLLDDYDQYAGRQLEEFLRGKSEESVEQRGCPHEGSIEGAISPDTPTAELPEAINVQQTKESV